MVPTERVPGVPPTNAFVKKIKELVVTAVVEMVIVPAVMAADWPAEAFAPVVIKILLPAVFKVRLPVTDTAPGVVRGEAKETIASPVVGLTVTWLLVPVTELTAEDPDPLSVQVAPAEGEREVRVNTKLAEVFIHLCPILKGPFGPMVLVLAGE